MKWRSRSTLTLTSPCGTPRRSPDRWILSINNQQQLETKIQRIKNMKFNKFILGLAAVGVMVCVASAQEFPVSVTRTLVLSTMQTLSGGAVGVVTNGPQDKIGAIGQGYIDIFSSTNAGGNVETAQIYTSPDQTNLTALSNFALITAPTTISVTNSLLANATNVAVSNLILLPGTITTPAAAVSGYAVPYLAELPFTNTGAITISSKGTYRVIINNMQDLNRYVYIVYTASGSGTNIAVGANLTFPIMRQQ
jgi:hypothetical protein